MRAPANVGVARPTVSATITSHMRFMDSLLSAAVLFSPTVGEALRRVVQRSDVANVSALTEDRNDAVAAVRPRAGGGCAAATRARSPAHVPTWRGRLSPRRPGGLAAPDCKGAICDPGDDAAW